MNQPVKVGMRGQTPKVEIKPVDPDKPSVKKVLTEKQKYEKMWTVDDYRKVSPGELAGNTFLHVAQPKKDDTVIDFGCGTGRGGFYLWALGGMNVTALDFASNCLDSSVELAMKNNPEKFSFKEHDLTEKYPEYATYGYCTDVMEHIPPDDVDTVLANILSSARKVFFRISTQPDVMGPRCLRQPLHLSVHDYAWWAKKFTELETTILYSEDMDGAVDFYVTGWKKTLPKDVPVNTTPDKILDNIRENAKFDCKHVRPHILQEGTEVVLLCGGPSLNGFEDEIRELYESGTNIVTMNGTYNWCQERGMPNVNQCMIDARPFNKRFVEPVSDKSLYFIATQCDPSVFEALPPERTFFWQCTTSSEAIDVVDECYPEYAVAGGGSTVALRTLVLMRILGFKKMTIYGMDSCIVDEAHHAYSQKENDYKSAPMPVMIDGRTFQCQPWMAFQAFEFIEMMEVFGDELDITVKGDGLIAHIIETGAKPPNIEDF